MSASGKPGTQVAQRAPPGGAVGVTGVSQGLSRQRAAAKLAVTVRVGPPIHEDGPGQVSHPTRDYSAPAGPLTAVVAASGSRGVARS